MCSVIMLIWTHKSSLSGLFMFLLLFSKFYLNLYLSAPNRDQAKISGYFYFIYSATFNSLLEVKEKEFSYYLPSKWNWGLKWMSKVDETKMIPTIIAKMLEPSKL